MTRRREEWLATIRGTMDTAAETWPCRARIVCSSGQAYLVDDDTSGRELAEAGLDEVDVTGMVRRGRDGAYRIRVVAYDVAGWETGVPPSVDPAVGVRATRASCIGQ